MSLSDDSPRPPSEVAAIRAGLIDAWCSKQKTTSQVLSHMLDIEYKDKQGDGIPTDDEEVAGDIPALDSLRAAATAAPRLRRGINRKVSTYRAVPGAPIPDGPIEVLRQVTTADMVRAELVRRGVAFDAPGAPWWTCDQCRQMFERGKGKGSTLKHTVCGTCRNPSCTQCGAPTPRKTLTNTCRKCMYDAAIARRTCPQCSKPKSCRVQRCRACHIAASKPATPHCQDCGKAMRTSARYYAKRTKQGIRCLQCAKRRMRTKAPNPPCAKCGANLSRSTMCPANVKARQGKPPVCNRCKGSVLAARHTQIPAPKCASCSCEISRRSYSKSAVKNRGGIPAMCRACSMRRALSLREVAN